MKSRRLKNIRYSGDVLIFQEDASLIAEEFPIRCPVTRMVNNLCIPTEVRGREASELLQGSGATSAKRIRMCGLMRPGEPLEFQFGPKTSFAEGQIFPLLLIFPG